MGINDYYYQMDDRLRNSMLVEALMDKSEFGLGEEEYWCQANANFIAAMLASDIGVSQVKTGVYTKLLGIFFPPYGKEGMDCIKASLKRSNQFTLADLARILIEREAALFNWEISEELAADMDLLYSDENSNNLEMELAKCVHELAIQLKLYKYFLQQEANRNKTKDIASIVAAVSGYDIHQTVEKRTWAELKNFPNNLELHGGVYGFRRYLQEQNEETFRKLPHMTEAQKEDFTRKFEGSLLSDENMYKKFFSFFAFNVIR